MRHTKKYLQPTIATYPIATEDGVAFDFPTSMNMPVNAKESPNGFSADDGGSIPGFDIDDKDE